MIHMLRRSAWHPDWVQIGDSGGIVALVTNGGFIDSNAFDGFRQAVAKEFDAVYCYNLRGDQRTSGDMSRREGGKIFGAKSRAGVAILLLVKKPGLPSCHTDIRIHYRDIGDYLSRKQKLAKTCSPPVSQKPSGIPLSPTSTVIGSIGDPTFSQDSVR